jgi:hypothetical protein
MGVVLAEDISVGALGADCTVNPSEVTYTGRSKSRQWLDLWNVVICKDEQQAFRKRDAGGSGIPSASSRPTIRSFHMRCKIHTLLDTDEPNVYTCSSMCSIRMFGHHEGGDAKKLMTRC